MIDALIHRFRNLRASRRPRWAMMPRRNAALLADIAFIVASILEREGVPYTIHHGCLLGATRLRGLLPWDIDIDLFILPDKSGRFDVNRLAHVCAKHGLHLEIKEAGQYFTIRPALRLGRKVLQLFPMIELDMLKASMDARGATVYDQTKAHRRWDAGELEPLKRYPFHGSWLLGPRNAEPVLARLYQEASTEFALQPFHRPTLPRSTDLFWRGVRPLEGETDWALVMERADRIRKTIVWRCLICLPWYALNGLYCLSVQSLRRAAGGHIE